MKKLSEEKMEKVYGGANYFSCGAMVLWGVTGIVLAATSVTVVGAAAALGAGAAMLDSANSCVGGGTKFVRPSTGSYGNIQLRAI